MVDIKIGDMDATLVFKENRSVDIILPKIDETTEIPDYIHTAVCIGALLKQNDPIIMNYCQQQYDVMWKKITSSEKKNGQ